MNYAAIVHRLFGRLPTKVTLAGLSESTSAENLALEASREGLAELGDAPVAVAETPAGYVSIGSTHCMFLTGGAAEIARIVLKEEDTTPQPVPRELTAAETKNARAHVKHGRTSYRFGRFKPGQRVKWSGQDWLVYDARYVGGARFTLMLVSPDYSKIVDEIPPDSLGAEPTQEREVVRVNSFADFNKLLHALQSPSLPGPDTAFGRAYLGEFGQLSESMNASRWVRCERLAINENIKFIDRYTALGIDHPDVETMCQGPCEGTGIVPVQGDDDDPELLRRWRAMESENPADDGWHFVVCPACEGSRLRVAEAFGKSSFKAAGWTIKVTSSGTLLWPPADSGDDTRYYATIKHGEPMVHPDDDSHGTSVKVPTAVLTMLKKLMSESVAEEDGHWRTTPSGHKIFIDGAGKVTKGNPHVLKAQGSEKSSDALKGSVPDGFLKSNGMEEHPIPKKGKPIGWKATPDGPEVIGYASKGKQVYALVKHPGQSKISLLTAGKTKESVEESDAAIKHKYDRMQRGQTVVVSDEDLTSLEAMDNWKNLASKPNPKQVGSKDRYLAWFKDKRDEDYALPTDQDPRAIAVRELSDLDKRKPRPASKMFGANITSAQKDQHAEMMRSWSKEQREIRARIKKLDSQGESVEEGMAAGFAYKGKNVVIMRDGEKFSFAVQGKKFTTTFADLRAAMTAARSHIDGMGESVDEAKMPAMAKGQVWSLEYSGSGPDVFLFVTGIQANGEPSGLHYDVARGKVKFASFKSYNGAFKKATISQFEELAGPSGKAKVASAITSYGLNLQANFESIEENDDDDYHPPRRAAGGVVINARGRILLRKPTNAFGGYVWTFPKGGMDAGESIREAAIREVSEETGFACKILGRIGEYRGDTSITTMFLMVPMSKMDDPDEETESVAWVNPDRAVELLSKSYTSRGRARDLLILRDAIAMLPDLSGGASIALKLKSMLRPKDTELMDSLEEAREAPMTKDVPSRAKNAGYLASPTVGQASLSERCRRCHYGALVDGANSKTVECLKFKFIASADGHCSKFASRGFGESVEEGYQHVHFKDSKSVRASIPLTNGKKKSITGRTFDGKIMIHPRSSAGYQWGVTHIATGMSLVPSPGFADDRDAVRFAKAASALGGWDFTTVDEVPADLAPKMKSLLQSFKSSIRMVGSGTAPEPTIEALSKRDRDSIEKMAPGAIRQAAVDKARRDAHFAKPMANVGQADWVTLEGVQVLRRGDSPYVAVPTSGKKTSKTFDVIKVDGDREHVAQIKSSEVAAYLARMDRNAKDEGLSTWSVGPASDVEPGDSILLGNLEVAVEGCSSVPDGHVTLQLSNGQSVSFSASTTVRFRDEGGQSMPESLDEASKFQDHVYDDASAEVFANRVQTLLKAPFVVSSVSRLGGSSAVMVKVSLDPKESWANDIWQNSRWMVFSLSQDGTIEQTSKGHKSPKFRKVRAVTDDAVIAKINAFLLASGGSRSESVEEMAKLSSYGRVTLLRASIEKKVTGDDAIDWSRTTRAWMSDGNVLEKRDVNFVATEHSPARKHSYGWKQAGKIKAALMTDPAALLAAMSSSRDKLVAAGWAVEEFNAPQ